MILGLSPSTVRAMPYVDVLRILSLRAIHGEEHKEAADAAMRKQDRAGGRHKYRR